MFSNRHEVHRVQAHTVCTVQIGENRQNRTSYNGVGGRTTGLQTLSQQCSSLTLDLVQHSIQSRTLIPALAKAR